MYTFFSLIIFFSGLIFFGWFFSIIVLKEKRIFALIPLSVSLGIFSYLILLNIISYVVNIQLSFYLVWIFLFLIGVVLTIIYRQEKISLIMGISKRYFKYLIIIAIIVSIITAIGVARISRGDDLGFTRLSLTGWIAGSSFPIKDVSFNYLQKPVIYHYNAELFNATIYKLTSLSTWFSYAVQRGIFAGLLILLSFLLCYKITKNEFVSLFGSLVFFFGSSLKFLSIFIKGPAIFYRLYFLKESIEAPFAFIGESIGGYLCSPVASMVQGNWHGIAFSAGLLVIYLYFLTLERKNWFVISVLGGIFLGFLALSAETHFVVIGTAIFIYPFLIFFIQKWTKGKWQEYFSQEKLLKIFLISATILFIGGLMAIWQGGVITSFIQENLFAKKFVIHMPMAPPVDWNIGLFGSVISIIDFSLLILFFILSLFYLKNKRIISFIVLLTTISLAPLLLFTYKQMEGDICKFLNFPIPLIYLLFGMVLASLILRASKIKKIILYFFFCLIITGGIVIQLFNILYPVPWKSKSFFMGPPSSEFINYQAKDWILKNTHHDEYFMAFQDPNNFSGYIKYELFFIENLFFVAYYNRLNPIVPREGLSPYYKISSQRRDMVDEMKNECSHRSLKYLSVDYIYSTPQWPDGLEEKCLNNNNLELKFENDENNQSVKIYEVK